MVKETRRRLVFSSLLVACALIPFLLCGCGSSGNDNIFIIASATPTPSPSATSTPTATPTPTPTRTPTPTPTFPPPFNTSKGEGDLVSSRLVVTYQTATSGSVMGLDSYYSQTICPDTISPADCATNKSSLNTPVFGNFDVSADPIGDNPLGIKAVDAVKIEYTAINVNQAAVTVSGGIVIPKVAPISLKGLILFFHETTVQRTDVPSNFLTPANSETANTDGILLAALWASQGYVVVMPDYIGLGDDISHPHPYVLYPQQDAQSGLAMVKAARSLLAAAYGITGPLPLHVTGDSEGGAYSLEAAHLMQDDPAYAAVLDVRLADAVPLSGAFDLTGTMLPYLFYNISPANNPWFSLSPEESGLSKPYLSADIVLGFASYSGIAPTAILANAFYTCAGSLPCGSSGNLDGLYYTTNSDFTVIESTVEQALRTTWSPASNAITPLLTDAYATALMDHDRANPLYHQAAGADTYLFVPTFPVTIVSLMEDSVVTRKNSDVAFTYFMRENPRGPYQEDLVDNGDFLAINALTGTIGPVDHTSELPFLGVLMLSQFNTAK